MIDSLVLVFLSYATLFRVQQYTRFKTHFRNGTSSGYPDHATDPIVSRFHDIVGFYFVMVASSIIRIMFGIMVTLKCFMGRRCGPKTLVEFCWSISAVNTLLFVIMVSMYHEDISNDLYRDLDIDHNSIDDKRPSLEFIIGVVGILFNLCASIISFGYDFFQSGNADERTRTLRTQTTNYVLNERMM